MRLIVGISGASGVVMGYKLIKALKEQNVEVHLVISDSAKETLRLETDLCLESLTELVDVYHENNNLAASISSGSFFTDGMIICPCSMKTLAGIVSGYADNLLGRAADVCLKEGRKVVLVPREMPLGKVHLRNLYQAADLGCAIVPPMLTFYNQPATLQDQIHHVIGKVISQFGLTLPEFRAWEGTS